jgi:hypothetical protein
MQSTIEHIRQIALRHYEQGGDIIVECFTDSELEQFVQSSIEIGNSPIDDLYKLMSIFNDRQTDADYHIRTAQ